MENTNKPTTLWGAAFKRPTDGNALAFTAGRDIIARLPSDYALLPYDLWVNKVHCLMLVKQDIITPDDAKVILSGLKKIEELVSQHNFILDPQKEDVHTNIESFLIEKYGYESCGKLHTARSRNDQSSTDTKLFLRDSILQFSEELISLSDSLTHQARKYENSIVPGFTHHQHAMVTTFGHILMSFAVMITRDIKRLLAWFPLHNTNPLGNAVSYGTSFQIDQQYTTKLFGFSAPDLNSLDQISNRWEAEADFAFALTVCMNHLSLIAQTLILFATPEFGMVQLSDRFSTGSSIMPHKKNPDPLEVIKAKASYAGGQLQSLLSIGKANFIGYNRDSQWTKYILMDLIAECTQTPTILTGILQTLTVNKKQMAYWCTKGFIGTTMLLEQMVITFHIPFRRAKMIVEKAVRNSPDTEMISYEALTTALTEEDTVCLITKEQVQLWQDPLFAIKMNMSLGGPNPYHIEKTSHLLSQELQNIEKTVLEKKQEKASALHTLEIEMTSLLNQKVNSDTSQRAQPVPSIF